MANSLRLVKQTFWEWLRGTVVRLYVHSHLNWPLAVVPPSLSVVRLVGDLIRNGQHLGVTDRMAHAWLAVSDARRCFLLHLRDALVLLRIEYLPVLLLPHGLIPTGHAYLVEGRGTLLLLEAVLGRSVLTAKTGLIGWNPSVECLSVVVVSIVDQVVHCHLLISWRVIDMLWRHNLPSFVTSVVNVALSRDTDAV